MKAKAAGLSRHSLTLLGVLALAPGAFALVSALQEVLGGSEKLWALQSYFGLADPTLVVGGLMAGFLLNMAPMFRLRSTDSNDGAITLNFCCSRVNLAMGILALALFLALVSLTLAAQYL